MWLRWHFPNPAKGHTVLAQFYDSGSALSGTCCYTFQGAQMIASVNRKNSERTKLIRLVRLEGDVEHTCSPQLRPTFEMKAAADPAASPSHFRPLSPMQSDITFVQLIPKGEWQNDSPGAILGSLPSALQ